MDVRLLRKEDFEPHLGTMFTVAAEGRDVELKLEGVKEFPQFAGEGVAPDGQELAPRCPFALSLSGPKDALLKDAMFTITHADLGELWLYVKAYLATADSNLYEIVFN